MNTKEVKVFVAMSGGVDSSVAALLLKNRGYDVTGVFMRCYNVDGCQERDVEDARRVAGHLEIPFYVWDFEEDYKRRVVDYMIEGYRAGITPNPDVMCNREIKFGLFFDRARSLGADYVATGHYVRLASPLRHRLSARSSGEPQSALSARRSRMTGTELAAPARAVAKENLASFGLYEAEDKNKDQSYFLWTLTEEKLAHCLFPIGDYLKPDVREMAREAGLPTAEKKDSQGICFLGKVTLSDFLKEYIPGERGAVLNTAGEKVGEHDGAEFYTIGQRHGIGAMKHQKGNTVHAPAYVVAKDVAARTVTIAEGSDNPALYRREIELADVNYIGTKPSLIRANRNIEVYARVRYRQPLAKATLEIGKIKGEMKLVFDEPQKFVASGQSAVFYLPDSGELRMLGGGVIR